MLRDYNVSSMDGVIHGAEHQPQEESQPTAQPLTNAERAKAVAEKEKSYIWKERADGMLVNQHGHLKTKPFPVGLHADYEEQWPKPKSSHKLIAPAAPKLDSDFHNKTLRQMLEALDGVVADKTKILIARSLTMRLIQHGDITPTTTIRQAIQVARELVG